MASRIRGITIEIAGNTKPLEKALGDVNKRSNSLKTELKDVERLLKFNPQSAELLAQKQKLLADQVGTTTEKLGALKDAEKQVQEQVKKGEISEIQYRNFKREIEFTEGALRNLKTEFGKTATAGSESADKMKQSFHKARDAAKEVGSALANGVVGAGAVGVAAVGGLVSGMQDYNQDLAKLKTNAYLAGKDIGLVEEAFMKVNEITGETDSAVETVSNLLASGFSDTQLADAIDLVNGAAIKFSDTLKTEGIADGIQETFATGEAVGPFAELLERSGIKLDDFNTKLQDAKTKGEGTNFIMQTLADQGFASVYEKYKELNPEVQKNAEENAKLQKGLGDLAITLTPLVTMVTEFITKITDWVTKNPELARTIATVAGVVLVLTGLIVGITTVLGGLSTAALGLNIAMGPLILIILAIVAAVAGLIAIGVLLWKNWDTIKEKASALGSKFKSSFNDMVDLGKKKIKELKDDISEKVDAIIGFFKGLGDKLKFSIPKPKLPKFSLSGEFSLKPPSVPKVAVDWFKDGGVFPANSPRLIGIGDASVPEAALPLSDSVLGKIAGMIAQRMPGTTQSNQDNRPIILQVALDGRTIAETIYKDIDELQAFDFNRNVRMNGMKGY
jgi:phage-related minor tail protein